MDWARWAKEQGELGADELIAYLQDTWPAIRAKYYENTVVEQGLATPVQNGPGAQSTEGMD